MELLQSELATLEPSPKQPSATMSDKQRAEERLKLIALRCELHVQRHEMTKKMRTATQNKTPAS